MTDSTLKVEMPEELTYSSDRDPGITVDGNRKTVRYLDRHGKEITSPNTLERIRLLVIPPAWRDVWICPTANGHVQATGRDDKGRKQAIYHREWHQFREESKFEHQLIFGKVLPKIRKTVADDLVQTGLPKRRILAGIVRLLDSTHIRIGNQQYAAENDSFGLTTLRINHVAVRGSKLEFKFMGKSKKPHLIRVEDPVVAKIVRKLQGLPGQHLFDYLDDDRQIQGINSRDVNSYLSEISGVKVTAKDFRTWEGSVEALQFIRSQRPTTARELTSVVKQVAASLGNTPAVCRKHYIHPRLLDEFRTGDWINAALPRAQRFVGRNERLYVESILNGS